MVSYFLDLISYFLYSDYILTIIGIVFPFYLFFSTFALVKYISWRE